MKKHIGVLALAVIVVGSLAVYTFAYQVDEQKDIVLIETFGRVTREIVGRDDPGLRFKWPWPIEKVIRYDGRVSVFEDTGDEANTKDKQNLLMTVYCAWRIAEPGVFHRRIKIDDPDEKMTQVEDRIRKLVRSAKKDVMGERNMADFINTNPDLMKLVEIEGDILTRVRAQARADYGVEIVRVGIRGLGLPEEVTKKVIDAMKAERQRDVSSFEQEGEAMAKAIVQRAESDRKQILAFADRKANEIRSEGDQAAARYYKKFANAEFSIFLRKLESLKVELADKTVFLLDGSALPHIRWFKDGPSVKRTEPKNGPKPVAP